MSEAIRKQIMDLDQRILEQGNSAERAGNTYQAHMQLFNVAVGAKDEKGMEQHRLTMHTMLDVILDSGVTVARMSEERQKLALKLYYGQ